MVPPVPTPETKISTSPSVSFQISGPVVLKWICGLAGFLNCCRQDVALGVGGGDLLGLGDGALHALGALGEIEVRAEGLEHLAALEGHGLRHGQRDAGSRAAAATKASAMPVLPLVGSISSLPGLRMPRLLRVPDHGGADAALDGVGRIAAFDLGQNGCAETLGHAVEADQRSLADAQRVVVVDVHGCVSS